MNPTSVFTRELFSLLPDGWNERRLKYITNVLPSNIDKKSYEGQEKVLLCNYVDVYYNDFIDSTLNFMEATASKQEIKKFTLRMNDVIITKDSESPDDIGIPAIVSEDTPALVCGYHLSVIKPFATISGGFLFWYIYSNLSSSFYERRANGITRFAIGLDTVNSLPVIFPDYKAQSQIANFLDRETSRIDTLISKKQKQIELLQEKRQAIITRAVTKGLNPDVKMKDSGVEWIGEIPEHWEMRRLKFCIDGNLKYGANESAEDDNPENPRYIRITDFGEDGKLRDDTFKSLDPKIAREYLLKNGDVLFARSGATVGKTFIYRESDGKSCFAGYLIKASSKRDILDPEFLYLFTNSNSYLNWKNSIFIQATIQNIGADKYSNLQIPIPSIEEQNEILEEALTKTKRVKLLIEKLDQSIILLKEYRSSLITNAVSGQIDISKFEEKNEQVQ